MMYPESIQTTKSTNSHLTNILIIDDQKVVRASLQEILSNQKNLQVIGTADDGDKAIAAVESLKPDLVLMDIEMPKMNGIEVTQIICQRFPELKVLILSTHEKEEYVRQIISAGANGYILKNTSATDLVSAIVAVSKGYSHFGPKLLKKVRLVGDRTPTATKIDLKKASSQINSIEPLQHSRSNTQLVRREEVNLATTSSTITEEFLPPIGKWLTWGGISVVTAIALVIPATSILKYKTTVKTQATIRPEGEVRLVQAAVEGQIAAIMVKQGQKVGKEDVIATIDRSRFQTQKKQLEDAIAQQKLQLDWLNAQIASLSSRTIAQTKRNYAETSAAEAELAGGRRNYEEKNVEANTRVDEANAKLKAVAAALDAAVAKQNRYSSVAKAGAVGKDRLAEVKLEVKQQQQELEAAQANLQRSLAALKPSTAEIEMAKERIEQVKQSGRATVAGLKQEREALTQQSIELNKQLKQDREELRQANLDLAKTNIVATAVGTISELKLRNSGQTVQSGQEIAQIVPSGTSLEIKAAVSPQDISKLNTNQKVQMRISACPYPDYGTLKGTVNQIASDISQVQSSTDNDSSERQVKPAFFEVSISPRNSSFGRGKNICSLQAGMEGTADIITREETALKFLLRKARLVTNL